MTFHCLFDHQCGKWSGKVSTESTILDIHADGNLRMLHGCESHEDGVVLALVLCCSRLPTYLVERRVDAFRRPSCHGRPHAQYHRADRLARGQRRVVLGILLMGFRSLVDMRRDVPSPVGDDSREVAELEWGSGDLSLSHADPHDRRPVPVVVPAVEVSRVRYAAAHLVGDVHAERSSESKAVHVASPSVDGAVFCEVGRAVIDHLLEGLTEIGVAALSDGLHESQRSPVRMAADVYALIGETASAWVGRLGHERSFAEHLQCLCRLEGRAGRVGLRDRAVHPIVDFVMAIEAEDASRGRFYGHDAALLALEQLSREALQCRVEGERGGVVEPDDPLIVSVVAGSPECLREKQTEGHCQGELPQEGRDEL